MNSNRAGLSALPIATGWAVAIVGAALTLCDGCSTADDERNRPPVFVSQSDTSVAVGDTLRLTAIATDEDGDDLSYGLVVRFQWQEFRLDEIPVALDPGSGDFRYAPGSGEPSLRRFLFRVDDGRGGRDSTGFNVTVHK